MITATFALSGMSILMMQIVIVDVILMYVREKNAVEKSFGKDQNIYPDYDENK